MEKLEQRERLIELLNDKTSPWHYLLCPANIRSLADYLLENGVILPPCKVGDTVYAINRENKCQEMKFDSIDLRCTCVRDDDCMCGSLCGDIDHNICQYRFKNDFSDFGKTVFLTREEAEKALERMKE